MSDITSLPDPELAAIGQPLRTPYLLQQAGFTLGMAIAEGEPMVKIVKVGLLDSVGKVRDSVAQKFEDKSVRAAEAKLATGTQNSAARALKLWGRKPVARSKAAIRAGALIPDSMTQPLNARSVPAMIAQAQRMLSLLGEHAKAMDAVGAPTQPLLDEGRRLCDALIAADSTQELTRFSALPATIADFYARKGELYIGLKIINDAGHELYAHDPQAASRYNLSILHRRNAPAVAGPAPTPPAPTPPVATS